MVGRSAAAVAAPGGTSGPCPRGHGTAAPEGAISGVFPRKNAGHGGRVSKKKCPNPPKKNGHDAGLPEPPEGLTARQGVAVESLAQGQSTAQAAAAAGVSARTVRRWVKEP